MVPVSVSASFELFGRGHLSPFRGLGVVSCSLGSGGLPARVGIVVFVAVVVVVVIVDGCLVWPGGGAVAVVPVE